MDKDKEFLNKYWQEYENLIIKGRDDSKIITFRDAIKDTINTKGKLYFTVFFTALMIAIIGLAILLFQIISQGTEMLSWTFVSSYPSRFPEKVQSGVPSPVAASK